MLRSILTRRMYRRPTQLNPLWKQTDGRLFSSATGKSHDVGATEEAQSAEKGALIASSRPRHRWKRWTAEERYQMAEMRSQGKSFGEIADALGRSVGGVYTLDPHCTRKLWTPADEELLRSLRAAGKSYKTVTEYFPDRVFDQVTAKGKSLLCYPQGETERSWTPAEMELFIHLRDDLGLTIQQISHQMQRSKYSLMSMWKRISPTTKPRPSHYHPIELETTARMLAKGHSWREIASRLPNRVLASRRAYWYTVGTHKLTLHPDGTVEWHHSSSE